MEKQRVYIVNIINYEDDYKHRHYNGVYPEKSKIFKNREEAEKYMCEKIYDVINGRLECFSDSIFKGYKKYFTKEKNSILIKYKYDFKVMELLYEHFCGGEFVDKIMEYSIEEEDI